MSERVERTWGALGSLATFRIALGIVWLLLGALKAAGPQGLASFLRFHFGLGESSALAAVYTVAAGEVLLGVVLLLRLSAAIQRVGVVVSSCAAVGVIAHSLFLASEGPVCGCFGKLVEATQNRRLVVAGVILLLGVNELLAAPRKAESAS
jgi:hypothetical protein